MERLKLRRTIGKLKSLYHRGKDPESGVDGAGRAALAPSSVNTTSPKPEPTFSLVPDSPSRPVSEPASNTLWDEAYQQLKADKQKNKLVDEYERLLSQKIEGGELFPVLHDSQAHPISQESPPNKISQDTRARHDQMNDIIKMNMAKPQSTVRDKMDKIGQVAKFFDKLISEGVKASPEASLAWAGISVLLPLLSNPKTQADERMEALTYVVGRISYYTKLERAFLEETRNKEIRIGIHDHFVSLFASMLEIQICFVVYAFRGTRALVHDLLGLGTWKISLAKIKDKEKQITSDTSAVSNVTTVAILSELKDVEASSNDVLKSLLGDVSQAKEVQKTHLDYVMMQDEADCFQAFAPQVDLEKGQKSYVDLKDSIDVALQGTCEWFLKQEKVNAWLASQSRGILLVTAGPGCGKSVLSKHMVDHVFPTRLTSQNTICYFFFREKVQDSLHQALASLLHQLLARHPHLIKTYALASWRRDKNNIASSPTQTSGILRQAINDNSVQKVTLVIDALDECDENDLEALVKALDRLLHDDLKSCKLRVFLTGRPYHRVASAYQRLCYRLKDDCVEIPSTEHTPEIASEVRLVMKHRLEAFCSMKHLGPAVCVALKNRLLGESETPNPDSTYLWVKLVFRYLENDENIKFTEKGLQKALSGLPRNVEEAYERLIQQSVGTSDERAQFVFKAFSILLALRRPMSVAELKVAMEVQPGMKTFKDIDPEADNIFFEKLNRRCGLLLTITSSTVAFLHQTVISFLTATDKAPTDLIMSDQWRHRIETKRAHFEIAQICLNYLLLDDFSHYIAFWSTTCSAKGRSGPGHERRTISPFGVLSGLFHDYAASNWDHHLRKSEDYNVPLREQVLDLCDVTGTGPRVWFLYACCDQSGHREVLPDFWHRNYSGYDDFKINSQLWLHAFVGLDWVVREELKSYSKARLNDVDCMNEALCAAVMNGHAKTAQILISNGANVHKKNFKAPYDRQTILYSMSANYYERGNQDAETETRVLTALRVLLDAGAKVKGDSFGSSSPLHHAKNLKVIQLLLEYGGHDALTMKDAYGVMPLHSQAAGGFLDDQNQQRLERIKMIIEKSPDVDARDNLGRTALMYAQNAPIVELLLRAGADVDARDQSGHTALIKCFWRDWNVLFNGPKKAEILLCHNADINATDICGRTVLMQLADEMDRFQHPDIINAQDIVDKVKFLLEHGADAGKEDKEGKTFRMRMEDLHEFIYWWQRDEILDLLKQYHW